MSPEDIRHDSVLPAHREEIELHTADGLVLVGELATPVEGPPVATLVTLHPLPTHGGFMDSHVFRKAAARLPALTGIAVLRFNLRGVTSPRGTSQGAFDEGDAREYAERYRLHGDVLVYYNPERVNESVLEQSAPHTAYLSINLGLALATACAALLMLCVRSVRRAPRAQPAIVG